MRYLRVIVHILILFSLTACRGYYTRQKQTFSHTTLNQSVNNTNSEQTIAPYRAQLEKEMREVIAVTQLQLTRDGGQSELGNFVCDALLFSAQKTFSGQTVDIVFVNRGGLRANLPMGEITIGNIFELMPFDNTMVLLKINGKSLKHTLELIAKKKHFYAGLQLSLYNDSLVKTLVGGAEIDENKLYNIVTSDFVANGGDNFGFLNKIQERTDSEVKIRDAIINYCRKLSEEKKEIIPYKDDRLVEIK